MPRKSKSILRLALMDIRDFLFLTASARFFSRKSRDAAFTFYKAGVFGVKVSPGRSLKIRLSSSLRSAAFAHILTLYMTVDSSACIERR